MDLPHALSVPPGMYWQRCGAYCVNSSGLLVSERISGSEGKPEPEIDDIDDDEVIDAILEE